ncbi:hypothetical protein CIG11343_0774 [Campylobacter iguaniorum]|uniref:hypothetical protein n=1 Tax=Campylobacter iguaniorum TaxID=1244531 RepID=UPI0007C91ED2|nr:hypothetical protein [Campylobacter iguaniorum]ANE35815.1 hypothetical protein CIG11343_0774 [Campylobacter iguaniorum]
MKKVVSNLLIIGGILLTGCNESQSKNSSNNLYLKFENLPADEQDRYISKDELDKFGQYFTVSSYEKELESSVEPINGDINELKVMIETLRQKNRLLFEDNAELIGKNWAMLNKFREQKTAFDDEKKLIISKNLEDMNDAENQHYKNINDLTKKINDLQKENISNIKSYEAKVVALQNELDNYKNKLKETSLSFDDRLINATRDERMNSSALAEKNRYLNEEIKALKESMKAQISKLEAEILDQKSKMDLLKQINFENSNKLNDVLVAHTNEIIELQNKNAKELNELKNTILAQKKEYFDELNAKSGEFLKLKKEYEEYKVSSQRELESAKLSVQKEQKEITQNIIQKVQNDYNRIIFEQNATIGSLKDQISALESKFKVEISKKDEEYSKSLEELKIKAMSLKNAEDEKSKNLQKEVDELKSNLSAKDNQIASLSQKINEIKNAKLDPKTGQNYEILNSAITNLKSQNEELKNRLNSFDNEAKKLVDEEKKRAKQNSDLLIKYYENRISDIKNQEELILKNSFNIEDKKLVFEMVCDDLSGGKLSTACEKKLNEVFKKYDEKYFYEITPVVAKFEYLSSENSDLININLQNFKSSKDALKLAHKVILDKFGNGANLSYSNQTIFVKNGYGFGLKVYK